MGRLTAMVLATKSIVESGVRMYVRKLSLFHLPICCMSHLGHPPLAAAVAAPIRKECEDMGVMADWGRMFLRRVFNRLLVRYVLSLKVNNGPAVLLG